MLFSIFFLAFSKAAPLSSGLSNTTVSVGLSPYGVAYDPSNGYIYVANWGANTVSVIDGRDNSVIATIKVGTGPYGITFDPSNGNLYVADSESEQVSVIDGSNNSVIGTIGVGTLPSQVAYDSSTGYIYVTNYDSASVSVIDDTKNTVVQNVSAGSAPWGIAFDPSNEGLYVSNLVSSGTVVIVNGEDSGSVSCRKISRRHDLRLVEQEYVCCQLWVEYGFNNRRESNCGDDRCGTRTRGDRLLPPERIRLCHQLGLRLGLGN